MTQGRPLPLLLRFAWPLILGSVLQQGYSLVDAGVVGHFLGMGPLAAIGANSSVIFLILGFCNGCTGGMGIPVAQRFGAHDYVDMRRYVANSYRLSLTLSIVIALAASLLCHRILGWMQVPEDIFRDAYLYLLVTFIGIPLTMMYNLLACIIRALGNSRAPFQFLVMAGMVNVVLDLLFIAVLGWGTWSAALATVLSQGVSVAACRWYINKRMPLLAYATNEEKWLSFRHMGRLLGMGLPMGLQFSITAIGSIMLQMSNNALGTDCVTAFTVAMRIKMFFITPCENLGVAMATYCGQNLGAGRMDRVKQGVKVSLRAVLVYGLAGIALMWPLAEPCVRIFVDADYPQVIAYGTLFMRISCLAWGMLGVLCVLRYSIQGLGFTALSMFSGVYEMIDRILVSLLAVPAWQFTGVCLGDPTAWVAACLFLGPSFLVLCERLENTGKSHRKTFREAGISQPE